MKLFLWDIDGTLIRTAGAGMRALERAVADLHGKSDAIAGVAPDGKTDPAIVAEIFDRLHGRAPRDEEVAAVVDRYLEHLRDELTRSVYDVLPGITAALDLLEERGLPFGLATGNVERGAEIKLTRGDLWRRFPFGGYGSDAADRAHLVARAIERAEARAGAVFARDQVWVIGDTPRDIAAARANGARAIGVATGPHKPDKLAAADVVWETCEEFAGWIARGS